jgi:hypothetical protein
MVHAELLGAGSFVRLRVAAGTPVTVLGYDGEPYLRFDTDGTVEENTRSPAAYLNRTRYAGTPVPVSADAKATPEWRRVGAGGEYAWHDHRTHWMATGRPPAPQHWHVPLLVAGRPVTLDGVYQGVPAPASWPWWLAVLAVGLGVGLIGGRWPRAAGGLAAAVAVVGLPVAVAVARLPAAGVNGWTGVALCAIAMAAGVAAVFAPSRAVVGPLLAGAGLALLLWAGRRLSVLDHAVLVTGRPDGLDRAGVATGVGAGVALLVTGVRAALSAPARRPAQADTHSLRMGASPGSAPAGGGPNSPTGSSSAT